MATTKCKPWFNFFKQFDQFGSEMNFRIKDDTHYRSMCGGITFTLYFALSAYYIIANFIQFATRGNMTLISTTKREILTPPINFPALNYNFAFALTYDSNGESAINDTSKYLDFTASYTNWTGNNPKIKTNIAFIPCTMENFYFPQNQIDQSIFDVNNLADCLCLNASGMAGKNITGTFTDNIYKYVEATVSIKPAYLNRTAEIADFLAKNPIKHTIYFIDTGLDYDDLHDPIKGFVNSFYTYLDVNQYVKINLEEAIFDWTSDENILFATNNATSYPFFQIANPVNYPPFDRLKYYNSNSLNLVKYYIIASQRHEIVTRTYQKITDFLANMTGILSQIILVLIFVIGYANDKRAQESIMHNVMKFKGKKNYDVHKLIDLFHGKITHRGQADIKKFDVSFGKENNDKFSYHELQVINPTSMNIQTKQDGDVSSRPLQIKQYVDILSIRTINDKMEDNSSIHIVKKDTAITHMTHNNLNLNKHVHAKHIQENFEVFKRYNSIEVILQAVICRKNKRKVIVLQKAEDKINFYLDIMTYLRKMQEIDALKYILLTKEQLTLFNFLSVSTLSTSESKSEIYKEFLEEQENKKALGTKQLENIHEAYESIINKSEFSVADHKLVKLFNSEVEDLIE